MAKTKATKEPGIQIIEGTRGSYYRVQIRLKGCPHISKNFDSFQKAKDWKRKTIAAIQSGQPYETTEMRRLTLSDLIDRFISSDLLKLRNHKTIKGHLSWWKDEIGYCILSQLREDIIAQARDKLKEQPDKWGRSRSSATVNRYLCSLGSVINLAVREWRLLPYSPLKNVRKLPEPRGRERFLSKEEKKQLLLACQNSSCKLLYPIVLLALSTGMRKGEILSLKWKHVNLTNGSVTLEHTKNNDRRVVPVPDISLNVLKSLHAHCSHFGELTDEYVFSQKKGHNPIDFRASWKAALKQAKIKDFKFHDLRPVICHHISE